MGARRHKNRQVGEDTLIRYRDGVCTFACHHDRCCAYWRPRRWREGLRQARQHAADHARYGASAPEVLPPTIPRWRPLRRLAAVVAVLALAALAFMFTVANVTGHAAPAPAAPSTAVVPTTTMPFAGPASCLAPNAEWPSCLATTKPAPHRPPTSDTTLPTSRGRPRPAATTSPQRKDLP